MGSLDSMSLLLPALDQPTARSLSATVGDVGWCGWISGRPPSKPPEDAENAGGAGFDAVLSSRSIRRCLGWLYSGASAFRDGDKKQKNGCRVRLFSGKIKALHRS